MRSPKLKGYELGADLGCKVQWRIRQIKMVSYVERFLDCWLGKNPLWQLYGEGVSEKGKGKKGDHQVSGRSSQTYRSLLQVWVCMPTTGKCRL